jgi:predicted nucleic acid-binding protein
MKPEFLDANILVYAHAKNAGDKQPAAAELIRRLIEAGKAALSIQVLAEPLFPDSRRAFRGTLWMLRFSASSH